MNIRLLAVYSNSLMEIATTFICLNIEATNDVTDGFWLSS